MAKDYSLYAEKWDYPPFLTTVIFAAYGAVAVVATLVSGALSDRYGRRPVLLVALLLLLAGLAVFVFAAGPGYLVVARMLNGLGIGAIVVVGGAALLDVSPDRAARSGTLTAIVFNAGIAVAALGTADLAQTGFHPLLLPYLADALIALVLFVLLLVMREPHPAAGAAPLGIPRPQVPKEIRGRFVFAVIGAGAAWAVLGSASRWNPRSPPTPRTSTGRSSAVSSSRPCPSPPPLRRSSAPATPPARSHSSATRHSPC
ncbi:MFS transporter [Actinoallomurus sp. NPDC052274]|uniref:MFS transporter n=1 Tax=Actinoallomurus sp. NPDC052274 TaxID=3155420 RepID=UPI00343ECA29